MIGLQYFLILLWVPMVLGQNLFQWEQDIIQIIQKARPSLVRLEINYHQRNSQRISSGIIFDQAGHIVTIASAVQNNTSIQAYLPNGKKLPCRLIGLDSLTNIAVMKVNSVESLVPVSRGYSQELQVGATLITLGNPYGLNNSVAIGIVSGLDRPVWMRGCNRPLTGLIQTTAPINPGDDGGLVVDSQGRWVGMIFSTLNRDFSLNFNPEFTQDFYNFVQETKRQNILTPDIRQRLDQFAQQMQASTRLSNTTSSNNIIIPQGIHFVLPSQTITWVAEQLINQGKVCRGWVGMKVMDTQDSQGVVILAVDRNSPAEKHGLQIGDRVLSVAGQPVNSALGLLQQVSCLLEGQQIELSYQRGQQKYTTIITLQECPNP